MTVKSGKSSARFLAVIQAGLIRMVKKGQDLSTQRVKSLAVKCRNNLVNIMTLQKMGQ